MAQDYSDWHTKEQAAEILKVSTKTIERLVKRKRLQQASCKRPDTGSVIAVYNPADVERIRKARKPEALDGFVVPDSDKPPSQAIARTKAADGRMEELFQALLQTSDRHSVRLSEKRYLTFPEAVLVDGRTEAFLRFLAREAGVTVKGQGPRGCDLIRQADLERI